MFPRYDFHEKQQIYNKYTKMCIPICISAKFNAHNVHCTYIKEIL